MTGLAAGNTSSDAVLDDVRALAAQVPDPELPPLTLADLGVLRDVAVDASTGRITVTITPTYSGCPALETMRADLVAQLAAAGYTDVVVQVALAPAWTTDWITDEGRRKLADAGIAPPSRASSRQHGPVPLVLEPVRRSAPRCPRCSSPDTVELSRFGPTPCKSLHRCKQCQEPFEHVKEH